MNRQERSEGALGMLRAGYTVAEAVRASGLHRDVVEALDCATVDRCAADSCKHVLCSNRPIARGVCKKHYQSLKSAAARYARQRGVA